MKYTKYVHKPVYLMKDLLKETQIMQNFNLSQAFNLSIMLQVDELESDRIFQMTLIECLEAIARIADKASMPGIDAVDLTWDQRVVQPLNLKLEKMIIQLANTCASEEYKLQYGNINKSMFTVVEEDD